MPLMSRSRRGLALVLAAALAIPALAMPWRPLQATSLAENRALAAVPAAPRSVGGWRALPRVLDAFAADHFAFREPMVRLGGRLFGNVASPAGASAGAAALPAVVDGKDGQMFLVAGLLRSTGQEVDPPRAADYAAFVCEAGRRAAATGARVLFAIAPSPATIYPELAPAWALPAKTPTEYDLLLRTVRACGTPAIDLRPAMRAAKAQGRLYRRTDSHWTYRGALVAYDEVVQGFGRPEWRIDPASLGWYSGDVTDGDLPRLIARGPARERVEVNNRMQLLPGIRDEALTGLDAHVDQPVVVDSRRAGPTVLIIGDSYSRHYFLPYLAPLVGKVAWTHEESCGFDWRVVDKVRPDYVLIMPVERFAACIPAGTRPKGF